jgi:hypothetical protein
MHPTTFLAESSWGATLKTTSNALHGRPYVCSEHWKVVGSAVSMTPWICLLNVARKSNVDEEDGGELASSVLASPVSLLLLTTNVSANTLPMHAHESKSRSAVARRFMYVNAPFKSTCTTIAAIASKIPSWSTAGAFASSGIAFAASCAATAATSSVVSTELVLREACDVTFRLRLQSQKSCTHI